MVTLGLFWADGSFKFGGRLGIGGADAFPSLSLMTFDDFFGGGEVLVCIGVGEAGPSGVIASFDGCNTSQLDQGAGGGVEVLDQCLNTFNIVCAEGAQCGRGSIRRTGWEFLRLGVEGEFPQP